MPRYSYTATTPDGRNTAGEIDAPSSAEATRCLELQGLHVESVKTIAEAAANESHPPIGGGEHSQDEHAKLSPKDFEFVGEKIAELTRAQLPLASGLAVLAEEMPNGRLQRGLRGIVRKLETGMPLENVLAASGTSNELQAVVRAGVRTGRTSELLAGFVAHLRSRSAVRLLIAMAFGYPMLICLMAFTVVAFFLASIVPAFKKIFEDFGTELPSVTLLLIKLSDFVLYVGWKILAGALLAAILTAIVLRLVRGPGVWQPILRTVPLTGPLVHWSAMARFCHMLAVMIDNGVPLPEALQLSADGTNDAGIQASTREMIRQVTAGEPPAPREFLVSGFPAAMIRTLTEHKQADALPETLHAVADMFESRARLQGRLAFTVFPPLILAIGAVTLGFVVIAMFMPLVKLLNELS